MKKFNLEKLRFILCFLSLFSFFLTESSHAQLTTKYTATSANGAEISAFDAATNRVFTVAGNAIEYYTLNSAGALSSPTAIPYGLSVPAGFTAIPNSVAIKNGILAFSFAIVNSTTNAQALGRVAFYNPATATYISDVTVGYLPDMIAFSPDGTKILSANEGEPNSYGVVGTSFDPEGSVSIIDISAGIASASVTEATFTSFNSQLASLKASGVRIYGPGATVAQDIEPEYLTFIDNATAAVTLQENNAVAIINIASGTVTNIYPLGLKDHSLAGNGFDASDRDLTSTTGKINIQNWPVKGMYMPDAIASFTSGGNTYYITANEGDSRAYTGYTEEIRVGAGGYVLDATVFPTAATLKANGNLGRLQLSNASGDTDGDGDFDEIHALGARSFTIWNSSFNPVFDSGDQLEQITAVQSAASFNSDGLAATFDTRSDNKGPEPEGVTTGTVNGINYAFVGSERTGDIFVYDITNPAAPVFKQYINTAADTGVEGIIFVPASQSPTGNALVITSAEVSKTVSVYEFTPPTINVSAGTIACNETTTTVTVTASAGTAPYTGTGTFTVGVGTHSYTVTDANGLTATASVTVSEPQITTNTTTIAANNSYTWSVTGQTYTTSGIKTGTTTNCVTELLDLTITQTLFTGPSTAVGPYVLPVASGVTTTSMLTVPETVNGYKMVGIPDGLGAFDNNNGTFTLLMNHELGNTLGTVRAHGAIGSFVSKWIINKSDLSIVSGSDLMTSVYGWNSTTQSSNTTTSTIAFSRFCSADLSPVSAYYNPATGKGTQDRIFMHGEEGGSTGYQVATVASGSDAGKAYILGKFNTSTNGSGLTGVGAWENALANSFPQDKTIVIGNNDGGTGIMNNSVCVYQGTKTNTGSAIDKAGLTNGTLKFVNVTGNALEIPTANATTRATNITSGTAFTLSATTSTTFSRPEDGAWDPADYNKYYFVTTDRLDQVADGIGSQVGRSRLWRLNFADITNPDLGGTIDLLLDGTEGQIMMDNMTFDNYGHILLLEDVGGAPHNGKVWQYTIATDQIKLLAKHDPAKFGDIVAGVAQAATAPFTNDEETSGIIDMSDILGAGNFIVVDQAHYNVGDTEAVEGGQLLKLYNPDTYTAAQCATTSSETQTACDSYTWNGRTFTQSGTYTFTSTNVAGCFHTATLNLTITPKITYYADADGDGYGNAAVSQMACSQPTGYVTNSTDCNDAVAAINPGHVEVLYNGVDDNCDGQLDEGFQVTTAVQAVICGSTLPTIGSLIYADINFSATSYRYKVVNVATNETQYYVSSHHWFGLNMLPSYDYAATYSVSVELQLAGVWLGYYGTACNVSTPAVLAANGPLQLNPSQCGMVLSSIGSVISSSPLTGATGYRFRITDVTPDASGANLVQVKDRSYHWFTLPMLTRYNYGSTYMVEVAVKTTSGYSGYGNACYITTPAAPVLASCGTIVPTAGSLVYTSSLNSVSQYRFQVTKIDDQSTVTFDTNKFWFSFRVNVPGYAPETGYSVRVAVMTAGNWSPFGDACEIVSPAANTRLNEVSSNEFTVVAYPNPYLTEFKLNVTTSTKGAVALKVYDMLGKLIETRSINTIDYISEDLGSTYPAGVYNVIVTQGENVKSLRVIKR